MDVSVSSSVRISKAGFDEGVRGQRSAIHQGILGTSDLASYHTVKISDRVNQGGCAALFGVNTNDINPECGGSR